MNIFNMKQIPLAVSILYLSSRRCSSLKELMMNTSIANYCKTVWMTKAARRISRPPRCKQASCSWCRMEWRFWNNQVPVASRQSRQSSSKDLSSRSKSMSFKTFRKSTRRTKQTQQDQEEQDRRLVLWAILSSRRSKRALLNSNITPM